MSVVLGSSFEAVSLPLPPTSPLISTSSFRSSCCHCCRWALAPGSASRGFNPPPSPPPQRTSHPISPPPLVRPQAGDFEYAAGMSTSARSLLDCILRIDPAKRFTISQVRSHPWFTQHRAWRGIRGSMSFKTKSPARDGGTGTGDVGYGSPAESEEEGSDVSTGEFGSPTNRLGFPKGPREIVEAASGSGATRIVPIRDGDKDMTGGGDPLRARTLPATGSRRNGRAGPSPSNSASALGVSTPDSPQSPRNPVALSRPRRAPLGACAFRSSDDNATSCCCPRREGVGPMHQWRAPLTPPHILTPPHVRQRRKQQRHHELNALAEASRPPGSPFPVVPSTPPRLRQPLSRQRRQRGPGENDRPGGGAPSSGAAATENENGVVPGGVDSAPGDRPRLPHGGSGTQGDGLPHSPVRPHQHHRHHFYPRPRAPPSPSQTSGSGGRPHAEVDSAIAVAAAAAAAAATGMAESAPPTRAARQLLFFVEEPDHVVLATNLREALEALDCACRVLRQCSTNMHVRVKACRGLETAEARGGGDNGDPVLGVIFALASPGAHRLGWAAARPRGLSAREHEPNAAGVREAQPDGVTEKASERAAAPVVTSDRGFERCNSVLVGACSDDGTDVLVTLSTGAPRDFHLLVQDLLASEGGRAIFLAGRRSPDCWSSGRMARRAGSAGPLLREGGCFLSPKHGQACQQ